MPPPPALTPDLMTIFFMGFSFPKCSAGLPEAISHHQ